MLKDYLISKGLSNREAEVAELVAQGLPNKEVAEKLFVTEKTVKFHLTNIYKKMNVKSRAQLIVWCLPGMSMLEDQPVQNPNIHPSFGMNRNMNFIPSGPGFILPQQPMLSPFVKNETIRTEDEAPTLFTGKQNSVNQNPPASDSSLKNNDMGLSIFNPLNNRSGS